MWVSGTAWRAYETIAQALRERVATGALAPGGAMPSENALAAEFHVVRNTVRRALALLEADGLVRTVPGRGRVVVGADEGAGAGQPQYRRIADALRAEMDGGALRPGDALPSEAALTARFGVSRGTARRALAELEGAGLVESRQGRGRFVRAR